MKIVQIGYTSIAIKKFIDVNLLDLSVNYLRAWYFSAKKYHKLLKTSLRRNCPKLFFSIEGIVRG